MENPLINLDKLSKPLTKLIEVISKGIGEVYAPFGTVRAAKADAEARVISAKTDIHIANLNLRAQSRLLHKESQRQENIEQISVAAARALPAQVSTNPVDVDWITQFFDHAQDIRDEEMQTLWGRILAGEVTEPGSYSKRTLQVLKTLDKWEAESFTKLCSFAFTSKDDWRFIYNVGSVFKEMGKRDFNVGEITHFSTIGLLMTDDDFSLPSDMHYEIGYFGKQYLLQGPPKPQVPEGRLAPLEMPCTRRYFSSVGNQLAKISGAQEIDGYVERVRRGLSDELEAAISFTEISAKPNM